MTQNELEEIEAEYMNSLTPEQRSGEIVYKKTHNTPSLYFTDPKHGLTKCSVIIDSNFSCAFRVGRGGHQEIETYSTEEAKETEAFHRLSWYVTQAVLTKIPMFVPLIDREATMVKVFKKDPRIQLVASTRGSHGPYMAHIFLIDPTKHTYELR